ncbi:MAG: hypothetical protein ACRC9E_14640, partial [Plesiomonas shigelloides]
IQFYIDSCASASQGQSECSDSILVLSGKQKDVTFDDKYRGETLISAKDFRGRYKKEFKINI